MAPFTNSDVSAVRHLVFAIYGNVRRPKISPHQYGKTGLDDTFDYGFRRQLLLVFRILGSNHLQCRLGRSPDQPTHPRQHLLELWL